MELGRPLPSNIRLLASLELTPGLRGRNGTSQFAQNLRCRVPHPAVCLLFVCSLGNTD